MYYIKLTQNGAVEDVLKVRREEDIALLKQKVSEANRNAGFLEYITQDNASEYLTEILAFAEDQKWRADTAEMKLQVFENEE